MSKRERRYQRGCANKCRYQTSSQAERYAQRYGLDIYPCLFCKGWHLTSKSTWVDLNEDMAPWLSG